jgi:hypothetical protein
MAVRTQEDLSKFYNFTVTRQQENKAQIFEVAYITLYKFYVLNFTVIYKSEIFLGRQVIILPKYLI